MVHWAGLSESILAFAQDRAFMLGADGVQLDKMYPVQLTALVPRLRQARAGGQLTPNAEGKLLTQRKQP
jgi:nicotinate-nucleotide pyrophosphorylase